MLKFLTNKLRTHSINEEHHIEKIDDDHDSGTESDEEVEPQELTSPGVLSDRMCSVSPADTGCSMESPAPDHHDPHSSEEELEVIYSNSSNADNTSSNRPLRAASVCLPEKRKWSQVGGQTRYRPENEENMSHFSNLSPPSSCSPYLKSYEDDGHPIEHSGSSDDEVHTFLACRATPVKFRTSPPLEAVKPGKRAVIDNKVRSLSPPPKVFHFEVSPRKRSRHVRGAHLQRPYLDFEKMQQLKARSVTAWRPGGEHQGELSVFCW